MPRIRSDAKAGFEFSQHSAPRQGWHFEAVDQGGGKCRDHCDHQICQALKERSGGRGECGGVWLEQRSCRRTYQPLESCEEANVRKSGIRAASITSSPLGGLNEPAPNLRKNRFKCSGESRVRDLSAVNCPPTAKSGI